MAKPPEAEDPLALYWPEGGKMQAIERWASFVMQDVRSTRGEIKVAWALSFAFNDKECRAWPTHETIAAAVGLSRDSVKAAIAGLKSNGHLIRTEERIFGKMMAVSRPAMNGGVRTQEARLPKGGRTSTNPRVDPSPPRGVDPSTPCIPDLSMIDPLEVEGFRTLEGTEEFQDREECDHYPP